VLISDTIGFIENLPTTLIKSFQSTLEETVDADVLLHVIDVSDPRFLQKIEVVNEILFQIDTLMKPTIYVFNKMDRAPHLDRAQLEEQFKTFRPIFVSAADKQGIPELKAAIRDALFPEPKASKATDVLNLIKDLKTQRQIINRTQKKLEKTQLKESFDT
jgi:GTP-binding protein HflX